MKEELTTNHTNHTNITSNHEKKDILFKDECFEIYGCIYAVNKKLGIGFLESVYQEALEIELSRKNIPFISQHELQKAQLMNYLAVTGCKLGLLVNFCSYPKTEIIRIVK